MNTLRPYKDAIAVNYPAALTRFLVQKGIAIEELLKGTGITPDQLDSSASAIELAPLKRLIDQAVSLSGIASLGLEFGRHLPITSHGMLGFAALSCQTYGESLSLLADYMKTRVSFMTSILESNKDSVAIQLDCGTSDLKYQRFFLECIAACIFGYKLSRGKASRQYIFEFAYAEPSYADRYKLILGNNVRFNADANRITIPTSYTKRRLRFAEPNSLKDALEACQGSILLPQNLQPMKAKVLNRLRAYPETFPDIESLAKELNMSSRNIRRKLKQEGASYQELVNQERQAIAIHLLTETDLHITQISVRLNFSDSSYFARAFKRWTGTSPSDYRKQHLKLA